MRCQKNKYSNRQTYLIHAFGIGGLLLLVILRLMVGKLPLPSSSFSATAPPDSTVRQTATPGEPVPPAATASAVPIASTHNTPQKPEPVPQTPSDRPMPADSVAHTPRTYAPNRPRIELNTADSAELVKLYGIGGYYANKILTYREQLGGFHDPEQLLEIQGIDAERLAGFRAQAFTDTTYITPLVLQTATEDQLAHHPYIGRYLARNILRYRDLMGAALCTPQALQEEKIITTQQAQKLLPYLK